jgi:excinuclease UvrABC nuclease subunit
MNFLLPLLVGGPDIVIWSYRWILILFTSFPIVYHNADSQKKEIYLNNKGKSGVYMWVNTINNNKYVGSSKDLQRRFSAYYSVAYLTKYNTIIIHRALLKYGYSAFSLSILEYCAEEDLISREQYYIDLYKPKYNILKLAGSSLGWKQSE